MGNKLSSLSEIGLEKEFIIDNMDIADEMRKKLVSMGVYPGQKIKLIRNNYNHSLVILLYGSMRVILNRDIGDHIWVKEKE